MENTDLERIESVKFFLKFKSYAEFSREIGLKNPQIFTDIRNKKQGISKNLAEKICNYNKNISFHWLLTGEGTMLNDGGTITQTASHSTNVNMVGVGTINASDELQSLREQLRQANETIATLTGILAAKEKEINELRK